MIAYTRDEIISTTDLARNISATLRSIVTNAKEKIAISKNNKLEAVLIDIEEYERLKNAYELMEHIEIAKMIEERRKTPKEVYTTLGESAKHFGIDLNEL